MSGLLFETDYGLDNSPIDNLDIKQLILYYSVEELKEFRKLCKEGMRRELGIEKAKADGNIADFLLLILREKYGKPIVQSETGEYTPNRFDVVKTIGEFPNPGEFAFKCEDLPTEEYLDGDTRGSSQGNLS